MLTHMGNELLLPQFEAARVFTDGLSAHFVPYAHLSFGPSKPYKPGVAHTMQTLTLAIEIEDFSIPSDNPIIKLQNITLEILYDAASSGVASDMSLFGTSTITLGGFDAVCTFRLGKNSCYSSLLRIFHV